MVKSSLLPIEAVYVDLHFEYTAFYGVKFLSDWGIWNSGTECAKLVIDLKELKIVELSNDGRIVYSEQEFGLCPKEVIKNGVEQHV